MKLIAHLRQTGVLQSPAIVKALEEIDRKDFVPAQIKNLAHEDSALPIGSGQTISQPFTVVFMLELLNVEPGQVVVDVGSGSAWQTALLAALVGEKGKVIAVELLPEICRLGKENLARYPGLVPRIEFHCQSAAREIPGLKSFDRLIAAADVAEVPPFWRSQLKIGGIMVYPSQGVIVKETKISEDKFKKEKHPGFAFVPFVDPLQKN